MARSHYRGTIFGNLSTGAKPLPRAAVRLFHPQTGVPWSSPVYAGPTTTEPYAIPIYTDAVGELDLWADEPAQVAVTISHPSFHGVGEVIEIEADPAQSATDEDIAESVADHEAKTDPHEQYLTEPEGNLLYLPVAHQPGTNPHPQYAEDADLDAHLASADDHPLYLTEGRGDLRYEQLSEKGEANGYVPLDGASKIPNAYLPDLAITQTFVCLSQAEMLALPAQTGDVCVRLDTTENFILAADPATVLGNWTKLAAGSMVGNTTVIKREEFTPAAAATTVALAAVPATVVNVSRNGVEQSALAGHFSVAGVTLTFTDAFVAGERVSVVYEVGSSLPAPTLFYTKTEADARFEPIDTMYTKSESDSRYSLVAHNHDTAYYTKAQADAAYSPVAHLHTATYVPLVGGSVMTGSLGPTVTNTNDLGSISLRWKSGYFGTVLSIAGASATANQITHAITTDAQPRLTVDGNGQMKWGPGATTPFDTTLQRTGVGTLRVDSFLTAGNTLPANFGATGSAGFMIAGGGFLTGNTGAANVLLAANSYYSSGAGNPLRSMANSPGHQFWLSQDGYLRYYQAPAVAPGTDQVMTQRLYITPTGTLGLTPDASIPALLAQGNVGVGVGVNPSPFGHVGVQVGFGMNVLGNAASSVTGGGFVTNNCYYLSGWKSQGGTSGTASYMYWNADGSLQYAISAVGAAGAAGNAIAPVDRFSISNTGAITLSPVGGLIHIKASTTDLNLAATPNPTGIVYLRPNGDMNANWAVQANNAWGFGPTVDNQCQNGHASTRWSVVCAVAGAINTSSIKYKDPIGDLDPEAALAAVLRTPTRRFKYKNTERVQSGYYLEEADPLFTIGPDEASPSNDTGILMAALQALCARLGITLDG